MQLTLRPLLRAHLALLLILTSLSACNKTEPSTMQDTHFISFSLADAALSPSITDVVFTVDTAARQLYNSDSISYYQDITHLAANILFYNTPSKVYFNDTEWSSGDTLDFTNVHTMTIISGDGKLSSVYQVSINKHKVPEDGILWTRHTGNLPDGLGECSAVWADSLFLLVANNSTTTNVYSSVDAQHWQLVQTLAQKQFINSLTQTSQGVYLCNAQELLRWNGSQFVSIYTTPDTQQLLDILGVYNHQLSLLAQDNGLAVYLVESAGTFSTIAATLPSDFAFKGVAKAQAGERTFYRIGGQTNTEAISGRVYATQRDYYWTDLLKAPEYGFGALQNGAAVYSGRFLLLFGGTNAQGNASGLYVSNDNGYSWTQPKSTQAAPQELAWRCNASFFVANQQRAFLMGGQDANGQTLTDIWVAQVYRSYFLK